MNKGRGSKSWIILWAIVLLGLLAMGCGLASSMLEAATPTPAPPQPTSTPGRATPTATPATEPSVPTATAVPPLPPMEDEETAAIALESRIIDVYRTVGPSVVNVTNRSVVYDVFMQPIPQEGSGSGFVYDAQGHIVTNYHVIEGATQLLVHLANGQQYEATLVGEDPINDLAVVQIEAGGELPPAVPLTDSAGVRVGQFVVAIGNPFGLEQTLTVGVISALGRIIQSPEDDRFIGEVIQTDAAINPGNSGGPLLDLQGRVIGVNSQIISPSRANAGIGFAVSSNTVGRVVPQLIARGYYPHAWLGINAISLTPGIAEAFREAEMNLTVDGGLMILEVEAGGPAAQAGILAGDRYVQFGRFNIPLDGDVITAIDGQPIRTNQDLTVFLDTQTEVGQAVTVTLIRDGSELTVEAILGERPGE